MQKRKLQANYNEYNAHTTIESVWALFGFYFVTVAMKCNIILNNDVTKIKFSLTPKSTTEGFFNCYR